MEVETSPPNATLEAGGTAGPAKRGRISGLVWSALFFVGLWIIFYAVSRGLPFIKNGSDIVFNAKLELEEHGQVFPAAGAPALRLIIFGNSKILAGFLPSLFDRMATAAGLRVFSFNSGFPGSDLLLPPLRAMCARGQAPNVLLLTLPWDADPPRRTVFHLILDDHAVIEALFPFHNLGRDLTSFVMGAPSHGGMKAYYREAEQDRKDVVASRGYYLITEQSRFAQGHLPDDFHLESDQPGAVQARTGVDRGLEIDELNRLVRQYHIQCFYVPAYLRIGEAAAPPATNARFAALLQKVSACQLLGPDYYLYPNRLFSDQTHLNAAGALVYTAALFHLVEDKLTQGHGRALQ